MIEKYVLIFDHGLGTIKAGHAGDEDQRDIVPTVAGKPKDPN